MNLPNWLKDYEADPERHASLRLEFILKVCSLHAGVEGGIVALSEKLGCTPAALYHSIKRGNCSRIVAQSIVSLVGTDVVTLEDLSPKHCKPLSIKFPESI